MTYTTLSDTLDSKTYQYPHQENFKLYVMKIKVKINTKTIIRTSRNVMSPNLAYSKRKTANQTINSLSFSS